LDLSDVVPLIKVEEDMVSTQYTMEYLEALGLIKMDFLGLRNLTIIDQVVKSIKNHLKLDLEILKIPLDDAKTLELIRRVDTVGIFQLESDGMKNLLRQMKATKFDDIVATIALFRPGPMENIPTYIKAKENANSIHYLHPDLKAIVEDTYGILIYQEQIMQVAQKMAGFTLGRADLLRKAMGKKDPEKLMNLKQEFIEGCLKKGYTQKLADELYELVFKFANYGFNKSHSVAYAMISYQMAYLKANYPTMFYAALLSSVIGGDLKTSQYLEEAKTHGVKILPPSINDSTEIYELSDQGIRLPLLLIRSVGGAACREILNERSFGRFKSFHDFVARINTRRFSRPSVESLIDAGAFDEFGFNRKSLLASLDEAYQYADLVKIEGKDQIRIDLGLINTPDIIEVRELPLEKAEREKAVLGFYLSDHPLFHIKKQHNITGGIVNLQPGMMQVKLVVMVKALKQHRTKKGDLMAFLTLGDEAGECSGVLMPNLYVPLNDHLSKGIFVMIEGNCEEEGSVFIKKIEILEKVE
jgi:DNA polymerase III subunit alpha